ncbi:MULTISPECIES: hypothetical protein [Pseudomonas]|uniref:Uncharacterized protein n=1 Tax=Pseudomonas fluorescens TaxID=294 RepID=A0A2S1PJF4_PSEFL|nr:MULTISPECIES: hypothetical protein [Pseudomonas]AWH58596.1 Hypothetical protein [Pseudomonas fluorescens]MDY7536511.1 hypothetical protein [Pseudomonas sp. Bout1]MEB0186531.1 hypothetical protein [Pseudomonas sp. Bout1]
MKKQMVLLDNCVWNFLWRRNVDLIAEQGTDLAFKISDLGEIEIPSVDHQDDEVKAIGVYAREQISRLEADPVQWFSYADSGQPGSGKGGFGELMPDGTVKGGGFFTGIEGHAYLEDPYQHKVVGGLTGEKKTKSGLLKNQTDVDYGQWALNFPIITDNEKDFKNFKKVILIKDWNDTTFGDFIREQLVNLDLTEGQ